MHFRKIPSKVRSGALATIYLLVAGEIALAQLTDTSSTPDLVRIMTDVTREWEVRHEAEETLLTRPSAAVLGALLPFIGLEMPSATVWNSRGRIHDREGTVVWQVYYAVVRTWTHHARALGEASAGPVLHGLLGRAASDRARVRVLEDLARYWTDEAESLVATLAAGGEVGSTVRLSATRCLLLHARERWYDDLVLIAEASGDEDRRIYFELFSDPEHVPIGGADPRIVLKGFGLLEDEVGQSGDASERAVTLSARLAAYLDLDFGPGLGAAGLGSDEEAARNAVWRALEWWASNQERVREEARGRRAARRGGS